MKNAVISLLLLACLGILAQDDGGWAGPPPADEANGKVFIKSDPAGASIFVGVKDESGAVVPKDTGKKTPALVEMPVGKQVVILSLEGYDDFLVNVTANPTAIVKPDTVIMAKHAKPTKPVDILFLEEGWKVLIDGKPALDALGKPATTPCTVKLTMGKHELSLAKDGFKDIPFKFEVTDKTENVEVKGKIEKSAVSAVAPKPAVQGKTVNLLTLIDPKKDAISGNWKWKTGNLTSDGGDHAKLRIPYRPSEEYDLHMSFTRNWGNELIGMVLTSHGHQFFWLMGGWSNAACGFEFIDGKASNDNPTTVKSGLETGKKYSCVIKVRKDGISAILNDKTLVEYKTDFHDFTLHPDHNIRNNEAIGIESHCSPTTFHVIEIIEVSGSGQILNRNVRPKDDSF